MGQRAGRGDLAGVGGRPLRQVGPVGSGLDLLVEAERMFWAGRFTPVPAVLDAGADGDGSWLVTSAVAAVGAGLRSLHDALPVGDCPWSWSIESRVAAATQRAAERGAPRPPKMPEAERGACRTRRSAGCRPARRLPRRRVLPEHPPRQQRSVHRARRPRCARHTAHVDLAALGIPRTSTSLRSASLTAGPTWRLRPTAPYGTTAPAGRAHSSTPTASTPTRSAPATTASSGISPDCVRACINPLATGGQTTLLLSMYIDYDRGSRRMIEGGRGGPRTAAGNDDADVGW